MFTDIQNDWAKPCIVQLEQRNIVSGYPDGTFRPKASLTRAEFAVLTNSLFPNVEQSQIAVSFVDLPQSHWAYRDIQTATKKRFFFGYPDGTFKPDRPLSRLQAIAVLASSRPNPPISDPQILTRYFDDASEIPNWAKNVVSQATAAQLVVNYPQIRRLHPQQNITRGEAAALSCRSLNIDAILPEHIVGFPPPPTQPRQLLNQTPETIQSYLGFPLVEISNRIDRQENRSVFTYVATGIWQLFPEFQEGGSLAVVFENNRSTSVKLSPNANPERSFSYDPTKVFRYLFGYTPKKIENVPGWYGGGHEGFYIYKKCLGDGLGTSYMSSIMGETDISIYADSVCQ
jgi:S-layer homology domain